MEKAIIERIKHIETFYEQAPPGFVKEHEEQPEECIPDTESNRKAREFLANAPKKGLWMPLGKEVKVMQCWKCKNYGHRTGDKECPLFITGNSTIEKFREMYEDPMFGIMNDKKKSERESKVDWLQHILNKSSTDEDEDVDHTSKKLRKSKKKKKKKSLWIEKTNDVKSTDDEVDKKKRRKEGKKHKRDKKRESCEKLKDGFQSKKIQDDTCQSKQDDTCQSKHEPSSKKRKKQK